METRAVDVMERTSAGVPSWAWLAGPAAGLLFATSLVGFAAARDDGYRHATKAVSELGAAGAPMGTAFNFLGFILPGLLIVVFALLLGRETSRKLGPGLLAVAGIGLVAAGLFAADMSDLSSPSSIAHLAGATVCGFAWAAALPFVAPALRQHFGLAGWARLTPWFALFLVVNLAWQITFQATGLVLPGWGQRIGFAGLFLWFGVTGWLLWRHHGRS